jgi:long-chain acyl-CoA synthetase
MAQTFCARLVESANIRKNRIAMTALGPAGAENTTFGEMLANIRSIAYRLSQEHIGFGDRVALIGENHPQWEMAYLGILYRGAVAVPLDPAATIDALSAFIEDSESKLAFVSPSSLTKFRAVCDRLGRRIPAVVFHSQPLSNGDLAGLPRYKEWARTPTTPEFDATPPSAKLDDIAILMYTSGTTGIPKAVPLTHGNIYSESQAVDEAMGITEKEVVLGLLPLFHVYSQIVTLWLVPIIGARVVYISELSSAEIERALKKGQITALVGVPRLWYLFHKKIFDSVDKRPAFVLRFFNLLLIINGWLRDRLGVNAGRLFFRRVHQSFGGKLRLAVSAGASFDAKVAMDFHRLGFTLLQGYGLTETAGAATVTRFEDNKIGSVGTPLDKVEVKIDEPNEEGIGEVLIRGPIVTPGYYRNPEANRDAFAPDGWFRSGDLGRFDKQGHLFIVGRKKDVVKLPTGKNIYPDDVEEHYAHSPMVSEVCVLGVCDESSQFARAEKLAAVVVPDFDYLKAHHIANAREAIRWELDNLGHELPEYQRVRDYIIRAEPLPRTTTRKVRRFELKQQIEASGTTIRQARDASRFVFTADDRAMMDSIAGRAAAAAIKQFVSPETVIHPQMNLELDLGLDSLARTECVASIEQALGIKFDSEEVATTHTVGELIAIPEAKKKIIRLFVKPSAEPLNWREILTESPMDTNDLQPILKHKPITVRFAYAVLRLIYFPARWLFRLEVEGGEVLTSLPRPFLICPNHQSYLDPILICSTYPHSVLQHIFHVGASEYFTSPFMIWGAAFSTSYRLILTPICCARCVRAPPVCAPAKSLTSIRKGNAHSTDCCKSSEMGQRFWQRN